MEDIEKQQSVDGSEFVDAFSSVMGSEHPGRLRLHGQEFTENSLKRKAVSVAYFFLLLHRLLLLFLLYCDIATTTDLCFFSVSLLFFC